MRLTTHGRFFLASLAACAGLGLITAPRAEAQPFMRVRSTTPKEPTKKDGMPKIMVGYQLRTGDKLVPTKRWKDDRATVSVGGPTPDQIWRDTAEADGWLEKEDKPPLKEGEKDPGPKRGEYTKTFPLVLTDFTDWIDLGKFPLPKTAGNVAGGKSEWPMIWIYFDGPRDGVAFEVQLADKPDEAAVVTTFTERTASGTIGFTLPSPLAEKKAEVETGSQMTARELQWATQLSRKPPEVTQFDLWTSMSGLFYDPGLIVPCIDTVRKLGINVVTGAPPSLVQEVGLRTIRNADVYQGDVEAGLKKWNEFARGPLASEFASPDGAWLREHLAAYTIGGDGSQSVNGGGAEGLRALDFKGVSAAKLNEWYRDYLTSIGVTVQLGADPSTAVYAPFVAGGDLTQRKAVYFSAKFAQYLAAKHLRAVTDGIRTAVPGLRTVAVLSQQGLLGAKPAEGFGSSAANLDPFQIGTQTSVQLLGATDHVSVELGNTDSAWSGVGTFEFVQSIMRSATLDHDVRGNAQIAPGEEKFLYAKSLAALGQGVKTFHFRDFGPTFTARNAYWSDFAPMFDGLIRFSELLAQSEDALIASKTITDPVAILYSVSSNIWAGDDGSAFSDMRLTWHALRHMGYQPNFVSEEQVEAGGLKNYKVLYVSGRCLAKKAGEAITAWVNDSGGVAMLAGGAATRDEFDEPLIPVFAQGLISTSSAALKHLPGQYNERGDLNAMKPLSSVTFTPPAPKGPMEMPAIGVMMELTKLAPTAVKLATFTDGTPAAASVGVGKGTVIVAGFLPGLAYGQLAGFKPQRFDEKWPEGPRLLIKTAVDAAKVIPNTRIEADGSGISASLLNGPGGPALILINPANRTLKVRVDVHANLKAVPCMSVDGARVTIRRPDNYAFSVEFPTRGSELIMLPR